MVEREGGITSQEHERVIKAVGVYADACVRFDNKDIEGSTKKVSAAYLEVLNALDAIKGAPR